MSVWEPRKLKDSIQQGKIAPLYMFFGDETFLVNEYLKALTEAALGDALRDFNLDIFYGGDDEPSKVRDAVETLPMMAARRVVIFKELQAVKAKDLEVLLPLLENPVESATVIFVASSFDQRLKFAKLIKEKGILVQFKHPAENEVPAWVQTMAKRHGKSVDTDAAALVHQMVGSNLMDIDQEIQKLAQYTGDRLEMNTEDVKAVVSVVRVESVFELANAIGDSDRGHALTVLARLLDHGENPVGIVSLVARHFRILMSLRRGLERGLSGTQLSSLTGVPSFFIRKYIDQTRRWDEARLETTRSALLETDRALKSSAVAPHIWLENFVIRTCV